MEIQAAERGRAVRAEIRPLRASSYPPLAQPPFRGRSHSPVTVLIGGGAFVALVARMEELSSCHS